MSKKDPSLWEKSGSETVLRALLTGLLVVLVMLFSSVMFCETCTEWVGERLGLYTKNPILKFLGIGMGGVLLALQALMSYKRAKALEDTANAQAEAAKAQAKATEEQAKANQNTEQGQRQERLKNAIEHLGHGNASVRLGGAYELFHLAQDTKDLRQTVLDILCAHIRRTTRESEYREEHKSIPSEEVQSLLTLLFVQDHKVFKGLRINLQGSWLNGANLHGARLEGAILYDVCLQDAHLESARLQDACLRNADLEGAQLERTHLEGAYLDKANLQRAYLHEADLKGACLTMARLQAAFIGDAKLQGAKLARAGLQGALLSQSSLQGAYLWDAGLQAANLAGAKLQGTARAERPHSSTFAQYIREGIGQETALPTVVFEGELSQEEVESIVEGWPDGEADKLRAKLRPHLCRVPSHILPQNSGAITGTYTVEEAERWIAEYEKAMSEVPEESDN